MTFGVIPKHLKIEDPKRRLEALKREAAHQIKQGTPPSTGLLNQIAELEAKA